MIEKDFTSRIDGLINDYEGGESNSKELRDGILDTLIELVSKVSPFEARVSPKTVGEEELEYNKLFVELYKNFIAYKWFTDGHFENAEEAQKRKNEIKRLITVFRR